MRLRRRRARPLDGPDLGHLEFERLPDRAEPTRGGRCHRDDGGVERTCLRSDVGAGIEPADDPDAAARFAAHPAFAGWPLVVLTDDAARATRSAMNFLWTTFTRFEPAADTHAGGTRVARHHVSYEPPVLIDARMKAWYPAELSCRPDTAARIARATPTPMSSACSTRNAALASGLAIASWSSSS